jgi:hypothetical protein
MSATDTCDGPQTVANQDFNNYDCTAGGTAPGYNKGCWTKGQAPPTSVTRSATCYSIGTDGTTLTAVDKSLCTTGDSNYDVYRLDTTSSTITLPAVACSSTTDGVTPCKFDDTAANLEAVSDTETCTGCTTCPTYVIGVSTFTLSSS